MTWKLAGKKHSAIVIYKVINNKAPGYFINILKKSNSGYKLRESESRLFLPKYNTELAKSSIFSYIGEKLLNTIILELLPLSLLFKKQINSLAII